MNPLSGITSALSRGRARWGWFDHLVRAGLRYKGDAGDRLAASLTFYAFLSLFPLLLLGVSVLGFTLAGREELQDELFTALVREVPGLADTFAENLEAIRENAGKTGIVGLVGVLFAGLGGITAARDCLRLMWHQDPAEGNFVKSKLSSVVTLVGLGLTLLASIAISTIASSLVDALLEAVGFDTNPVARAGATLIALGLALLTDVCLFLYLFKRLPKVDWPTGRVLRGAVFGAVGFGVLKFLATYYVGRAVANNSDLYGPVGAVIGILLGINLIARFVLFAAAWTVTAPGRDDVLPSATASPAAAAKAGGTASPNGPATPDPRDAGPGSAAPSRDRERVSAASVAADAEDRLPRRTADRTKVAAGAALGVLASGVVMAVVSGIKSLWGAVRSS